jgi:hypothetical protein
VRSRGLQLLWWAELEAAIAHSIAELAEAQKRLASARELRAVDYPVALTSIAL